MRAGLFVYLKDKRGMGFGNDESCQKSCDAQAAEYHTGQGEAVGFRAINPKPI